MSHDTVFDYMHAVWVLNSTPPMMMMVVVMMMMIMMTDRDAKNIQAGWCFKRA